MYMYMYIPTVYNANWPKLKIPPWLELELQMCLSTGSWLVERQKRPRHCHRHETDSLHKKCTSSFYAISWRCVPIMRCNAFRNWGLGQLSQIKPFFSQDFPYTIPVQRLALYPIITAQSQISTYGCFCQIVCNVRNVFVGEIELAKASHALSGNL